MMSSFVARLQRDLVVVSGPDATSFLQSLVSQDLDPVAVGDAVHALLLEPRGKLVADLRAARVADGEWWCVCEPGVGAVLAAGLTRFRIRVKVDIEDRSSQVAAAAFRGSLASSFPAGVHVVPAEWESGPGAELIGPPEAIAAAIRTLVEQGASEIDADRYEALRIEAGVPRQGYDIDETTIAQEAYLDRDAVSFTKGCFLGQELVCRIDTRGHVNRLLRRLRADAPLERGATVEVDGKAVGTVTSSAGAVGLAMLRREVEAGSSVIAGAAGARVEAIDT